MACSVLLKEFEKNHFSEFARAYKFEHYKKVISLLEMLPYLKCESTCRSGQDGTGGSCDIKTCIGKKEIEGCWDCEDFETREKLDFLKPICGDAPIKNLRKIKEYGIENWSAYREKQYPWL